MGRGRFDPECEERIRTKEETVPFNKIETRVGELRCMRGDHETYLGTKIKEQIVYSRGVGGIGKVSVVFTSAPGPLVGMA